MHRRKALRFCFSLVHGLNSSAAGVTQRPRGLIFVPLKSLVEPKLQWNAGQSSFDCVKESLFLCAERLPNNNRRAAWVCVSHPETDHLLVGASFREDGGHSAHLSHLKKTCSTWWATAAAGSPKFKSPSGVKRFFLLRVHRQMIYTKTNDYMKQN